MAAERCGLGSLLPTGCRGRAETFARRLSNRLRSLGHGSGQYEEDSDGVPGQQTTDSPEFWQVRRTGSKEALVVSPPDSNNTDRFYDFDVVDQHSGASSPANEDEIINESDGLPTECESGCVLASPTQANGAEGDSEDEASVYFEPAWGEVLADAFASLVPPEKRHQEVLAGSRKEQLRNGEHADDDDEDEGAALVPQDGARTLDSAFSESAGADEEEDEEEDEDEEEELCRMLVSPDAGRTLRKIEQETPEEHSHVSAVSLENGRHEITAEEREMLEEKLALRLESMEAMINKHVDSVLHEETLLADSVSSPKVVLSRAETPEEAECALVPCQAGDASPDDTQLGTPDETPRRVQRSSSLKTGKTPPGTPGRKKIVRFADVLGLDLADVRTFMDEIPKVPSCAYWDLHDAALDARSDQEPPNKVPTKCLFAMFQQPCSSPDFLDRLRTQRLCLENAYLNETMSVTGTVRVLNIEFHKSVHVRYTLDNWENFADLQASYVSGSSDGFSDKFSFILYANTLDIGQRLEFAVRYTTAGDVFWDNNNGANYAFQCLTPVNTESSDYLMSNLEVLDTPPPPEDSGWASFY